MRSSVCLVLLSVCVLVTCSSAQRGCAGHCGEDYFRGNKCQCDYECLSHSECCKDYEAVCTTRGSCKGRCGESFKRGRQCHCDIECLRYSQCCPDYETQCNTEESSVEEEYRELEATPPPDDMATDGAVSGSKPSPYDTAELLDPVEGQVAPLPNLPDIGAVPSMIGSPVTDKDLENPQDILKPDQVSPNISVPDVPPASTSLADTLSEESPAPRGTKDTTSASEQTDLTAGTNTSLSTESQSNDGDDNPEKPESESTPPQLEIFEPEQLSYNASGPTVPPEMDSTRPNLTLTSEQNGITDSQSSSESKPSPPAQEAQDSNPDLKPTTSVQSEDKEGPDANLQTQTDAQFKPGEVGSLGGQDVQNTTSAEPPNTGNITGEKHEAKDINDILPTKDSPKYPELTASTPPSDMVSPSPAEAEEEKPNKPKDDGKNLQDLQDYQGDASRDTNLCSGLPVNGLTTLRNGTIVVFRGHYFWMLDSRRNAGPANLITEVWGVPSPIDTVFTRCNCQGKTYIFRGDNYWRFENDAMDAGFPRPISEGFGLGGHVTAALSMPRHRSRREAVLFFKRGGQAQRYTYLNTPTCGSTSAARKRFRKEAVPALGPPIDISKTWIGFPAAVTSAVSVRTTGGDGYKYYVFSQTKYNSLRIEGETPVILTPRAGGEQQKSAKSWFRCPETSTV